MFVFLYLLVQPLLSAHKQHIYTKLSLASSPAFLSSPAKYSNLVFNVLF